MSVGLRRSLAALLFVALTLAGLGRALAAAAQGADLADPIPGLHLPICHTGAGEAPADPARPAPHDCCDDCALTALAVLPAPPSAAGPSPVEHHAEHAGALNWAPAVARPRSPRLSRGPPAA